jgi:hypothetical protein
LISIIGFAFPFVCFDHCPQDVCSFVVSLNVRNHQPTERKEFMNKQNVTSEYMLLFRGPHWDKGLSPEELQQLMDQVMAWFEGLKEQGKVKGGQPLAPEGRIISGKKGRPVADAISCCKRTAWRRPWPLRNRTRLSNTASPSKSGPCSRSVRFSSVRRTGLLTRRLDENNNHHEIIEYEHTNIEI